ncbi:M81 family metallopeptidase [Komagataeibacter medellinensis]|uniref:Microcystinase C n=1 Tax=Komagataeibacter medellinensis (strain NBRC 3288 / BCRC 11682 / LMG 1693 / Kondo 51) TaxID=634177 RepID=G2I286_KOMMN|nr:M81 family metallopeptidase [Komagataeibacter medellinensis]BAK82502.1 hypothetical protein GLX_00900 [Komagataeibacter medellinensis NBRC 3288]
MKYFIATLGTETNTFSPIPTGRTAFMGARDWFRTDGSLQATTAATLPLRTWRARAQADGHEVVESICAFAQPAGLTLRAVYEELREMILDDLRRAMPVDVVLLSMHGAMIAVDYDDCEGDLLAHIRAITGPRTVIGAELDLHCHLTETMRENASLIITYKEYPHDDIVERAQELYDLATRTIRGEIHPVIAYYDCRMLAIWRTPYEPVRSFVDRMQTYEGHDGILSVSFAHGFPWADIPDVGAKMMVIADGDEAAAAALARRLGREIWDMRDSTVASYVSLPDAIGMIRDNDSSKLIVIADVSDNAGGGAPSDNTIILRALLDAGVDNVAVGCIWDPAAVALCIEAGEGATFDLRLGGKCGVTSGNPIDMCVTVRRCIRPLLQTGLSNGQATLGDSVWLHTAGIDIVVTSNRQQTFAPDAFTNCGISLDKAALVVKSAQHFYNAFAAIAERIIFVAVPGCVMPDMNGLSLPRRTIPMWPHVEDPFA